jgi:hypothetical protein
MGRRGAMRRLTLSVVLLLAPGLVYVGLSFVPVEISVKFE